MSTQVLLQTNEHRFGEPLGKKGVSSDSFTRSVPGQPRFGAC